MNNSSIEFNKQLELDVLVNGLTEVTKEYVSRFDWQELDKIVIPKGVTSIGEKAFYNCTGLTSITIPDSVTNISYYAFGFCISLKRIRLTKGLTNIGRFAFGYCYNLTNITFEGKTLDEVKAMENYPWGKRNLEKLVYKFS